MTKKIMNECLECNKQFETYLSSVKRGGGKFCSISCGARNRYKKNPNCIHKPAEDRFLNNIKKINGCWEWQGLKRKTGYGRIGVNNKSLLAHRYSWELHFGKIPDGILVCHKCDNPPCVNPEHLFLGSHADNTRDKVKKGRNRDDKGENHPSAKLTNANVVEIKKEIKRGVMQKDLAARFNVCKMTISNIHTGRKWSHV